MLTLGLTTCLISMQSRRTEISPRKNWLMLMRNELTRSSIICATQHLIIFASYRHREKREHEKSYQSQRSSKHSLRMKKWGRVSDGNNCWCNHRMADLCVQVGTRRIVIREGIRYNKTATWFTKPILVLTPQATLHFVPRLYHHYFIIPSCIQRKADP